MVPKIGIKLADGSFLSIMDEKAFASEMLELTTVHDNQQNVQINLFKQEDEISEPHYIGSLIIENIQQKKAGEPTLELHLMLDDAKQLSAKVIDIDSGSTQTLQASLGTFNETIFDDADFSLNIHESFDQDTDNIGIDDSSFSDTTFYSDDSNFDDKRSRKFPLWLLILLILLGVGALVLVGMLFMKKKAPSEQISEQLIEIQNKHTEQVAVEKESAPNSVQEELPAVETPQKELPPDTTVTEPPTPITSIKEEKPSDTTSENTEIKETTISSNSKTKSPQAVRYKLRWGDTLWDISETYYRNPWLYKEIAEHNKLTNPDLIISGTHIEIPPR